MLCYIIVYMLGTIILGVYYSCTRQQSTQQTVAKQTIQKLPLFQEAYFK